VGVTIGLVKPRIPELDYDEWRARPRMERIRPLVVNWSEAGFGTPEAVYALYILKIIMYVLGGLLIIGTTHGLGGLGLLSHWWSQPIVYEKVVIFTLLFEVLGFGCGFGPLTFRFLPPIGTFLYWLRPGTIRLAPWPDKVPGTRGTYRSAVDVLLYLGVLASGIWLLLSPATASSVALGASTGLLAPARIVPLLAVVLVTGLRDKTIFLAARSEVYLFLACTFLMAGPNVIMGAKIVTLFIWWGAAFSKLNLHFANVVEVMETNSPIIRFKWVKRLYHRNFPDDIRPSRLARSLAHGGTIVEFVAPGVLFFSHGGTVTTVAAITMIAFHLHILTSLPMGVPLEWNVFMMYSISFLFVHESHVGLGALTQPWAVLLVAVVAVSMILLGNFFPAKISFLIGMRYYAGNWATSLWCLTPSAMERIRTNVVAFPGFATDQLTTLYGAETADWLLHKGYAFRSMHTHGRALLGLIPRFAGANHETDFAVLDGELITALHERCHFEPGEVRVIVLESQVMLGSTQEYRLVDAATGEFERGTVKVADMLNRQPWDGMMPTVVTSGGPLPSSETAGP
jgi:hypothetical protein